MDALYVRISLVEISSPRASAGARARVYCRGGAYCCRKGAAQVEEDYRLTKGEHDQPRSSPGSIDAAGRLEDFGYASINVRRAVENCTALCNGIATRVQ